MKNKVWEVEYEGHVIRVVINRMFSPFDKRMQLEIDGAIVKYGGGCDGQFIPTIHFDHLFNTALKRIEVRFGTTKWMTKMGCQIYINGQFVAGDKAIRYLDYPTIKKMYDKGCLHYIFIKNLPIILLALGVVFSLSQLLGWKIPEVSIFEQISFLGVALIMIYYPSWGGIKARVEKEAEFNE